MCNIFSWLSVTLNQKKSRSALHIEKIIVPLQPLSRYSAVEWID